MTTETVTIPREVHGVFNAALAFSTLRVTEVSRNTGDLRVWVIRRPTHPGVSLWVTWLADEKKCVLTRYQNGTVKQVDLVDLIEKLEEIAWDRNEKDDYDGE